MSLHVAFQGAAVGVAKHGGKLHRPCVKAAAGHADFRAHVQDALAPHPAYAQNRDSHIARAEFRRGIVGSAQMEGIGSECAVRPGNFGRGVPLDDLSAVLVLLPVLDGGMVHRHIDAADAHALSMGFQCVGFLRVNGHVPGDGDVILPIQRYAHIAVIFHAGKGGGDVQRRHAHAEDIGPVLAFVFCADGHIPGAVDGTVRDINIRRAPVDDTGIAYAHAGKRAYGDCSHFHTGTIFCLSLQGIDIDILGRDSGFVHGHVRVVVRMDNGVRNIDGRSSGRSDAHIFRVNVAGLLRRYIYIIPGLQNSAADFRMDAHLPGIRRTLVVCGRSKADGRILCRFEVVLFRALQTVELCVAVAKEAVRFVYAAYMYFIPLVVLRVIPVQMLFDLILGVRADARGIVVFIFGIGKLGIRDALVDGGNGYVHAYADAAGSHARHLAVKVARFFRFHVDII